MSKKDFRYSVQALKTKCHLLENISGAVSLEDYITTYPKLTPFKIIEKNQY
jgi:hypothetical protein